MKACVVQELSGPSGMVYTDIDDVVIIDVRRPEFAFPTSC